MSRGSAMNVSEIIGAGVLARVHGELIATPDATPRHFDFGQGEVPCVPLSFGDLVTAWHSTAIGERQYGFATPVRVFGGGFAESIGGTLITDL